MRGIRWVKTILIVFLTSFIIGSVWAGEKEKKHPIDEWLEKCIEKDSSTAGMINCSNKAYDMWDKELNKVYQELIKKLSPEERKLLIESQRQWIRFRDAEFKFIDKFYYSEKATMFYPMAETSKLQLLKNRVGVLQIYLNKIELKNDEFFKK